MAVAKPPNPLTLIMPLRQGADLGQLQGVLASHQDAIDAALGVVGTVHYARFVLFDASSPNLQPMANSTGPFQLAVITTYDGSFDRYINDFVDHIGWVFDDLLQHMADAPPLPVLRHRREFLDYVHRNDLTCLPPFYSASPDRTVLDIRAGEPA